METLEQLEPSHISGVSLDVLEKSFGEKFPYERVRKGEIQKVAARAERLLLQLAILGFVSASKRQFKGKNGWMLPKYTFAVRKGKNRSVAAFKRQVAAQTGEKETQGDEIRSI